MLLRLRLAKSLCEQVGLVVTHQRRRSWSTQCLEYCLQMQGLFGGLIESMQLCLGGGGRNARLLL